MKTQEKQPARAEDLNYHYYGMSRYDRDIVSSIPFHQEIHTRILNILQGQYAPGENLRMLDLGVGTGITSKLMQSRFPNAHLDVVDFSATMLAHAKKRLGNKNVTYIQKEYGRMSYNERYDSVLSVIGLHHQSHVGKKRVFKKIYNALKPGGVFILADLMTTSDEKDAAERTARHLHHLVQHAQSRSSLRDWAHHHIFLNNLATIEDEEAWLADAGFTVSRPFFEFNTAVLIAKKPL